MGLPGTGIQHDGRLLLLVEISADDYIIQSLLTSAGHYWHLSLCLNCSKSKEGLFQALALSNFKTLQTKGKNERQNEQNSEMIINF
jgi:hypothetical protein